MKFGHVDTDRLRSFPQPLHDTMMPPLSHSRCEVTADVTFKSFHVALWSTGWSSQPGVQFFTMQPAAVFHHATRGKYGQVCSLGSHSHPQIGSAANPRKFSFHKSTLTTLRPQSSRLHLGNVCIFPAKVGVGWQLARFGKFMANAQRCET